MGSYSFFSDEEIVVNDWKGLKQFLKIYQEEYGSYWGFDLRDMIKKYDDGKEYFTFEDWHDIKLISYWYDFECIFLLLVAKFIEGYVRWDFESSDECGSIEFINRECEIKTGVMDYSNWKPENLMREGIEKVPDKIKKMLVINSLK